LELIEEESSAVRAQDVKGGTIRAAHAGAGGESWKGSRRRLILLTLAGSVCARKQLTEVRSIPGNAAI